MALIIGVKLTKSLPGTVLKAAMFSVPIVAGVILLNSLGYA